MNLKKNYKKVPHTGDKESLDKCGQQQKYQKNPGSKAKVAGKKNEKKIKREKKIARQFYTLNE